MRYVLLFLLLFGFTAPAHAARRTPPPASLTVTSRPSGAKVWVDGTAVGVTPLTLNPVTPRSYTVVVGGNGFRLWGKRIQVRRSQRARVNARLKPAVALTPEQKTAGRTALDKNAGRALEWRSVALFAIDYSNLGLGDFSGAALDTGLGFFVDAVETDTGFAATFYLDEEETQPAGEMSFSLANVTLDVQYSFTAGPLANSAGQLHGEPSGLTAFAVTGNGTLTDGSTWRANILVTSADGVYSFSGTVRLSSPDGTTATWSASGTADGARLVIATSDGYRLDVALNGDGSGGGMLWIPGSPDPFAVFAWDVNGQGTITFSDGTTEDFSLGF
jgi:hypothetical protein